MGNEPAIRTEGLTKHYGDVAALVDLDLDVKPGEVEDLGSMALARERRIEALVVDGNGRPRAARIVVSDLGPDGSVRADSSRRFVVGSDGRLLVRGLGRGQYVLRAEGGMQRGDGDNAPPWVSENLFFGTVNGSVAGTRIEVQPARALVVRSAEALRSPVRFLLADANGIEIRRGVFEPGAEYQLWVPEGRFELELETADGNWTDSRVVVVGSGPETIEIGP